MTAADIAAKLTPAQVRALRDPEGCQLIDFNALFDDLHLGRSLVFNTGYTQTAIGRDVLAELDKGAPK